jgi:ubiquinone/menaquinone biosynthesis C-methylase UbiE
MTESPRSGPDEVGAAFDRMATVYDSTREEPDPATLSALVGALRELRLERLLEVGVGTGRVARPLSASGIRITGIDLSAPMLARARAKGLLQLVRGSAYQLPFRSATFDAVLFAHVLHLLDDPRRALEGGFRISRGPVVALLEVGDGGRSCSEYAPGEDPRRRLLELLQEAGSREG